MLAVRRSNNYLINPLLKGIYLQSLGLTSLKAKSSKRVRSLISDSDSDFDLSRQVYIIIGIMIITYNVLRAVLQCFSFNFEWSIYLSILSSNRSDLNQCFEICSSCSLFTSLAKHLNKFVVNIIIIGLNYSLQPKTKKRRFLTTKPVPRPSKVSKGSLQGARHIFHGLHHGSSIDLEF